MVPEAYITHQTPSRLRIKTPSQRGDYAYFEGLRDTFSRQKAFKSLEVNVVTGSVLLEGDDLDAAMVAEIASRHKLFSFTPNDGGTKPLSQRVAEPLRRMSRELDRFTGGQVDLPSLALLALLSTGVYQILRGNFGAPPWYTAFWYALGVFSKSAVDRSKKE
jgi:hypothetical protein